MLLPSFLSSEGVEPLHSVLFQCRHQNLFRHLEACKKVHEVLVGFAGLGVIRVESFRGYSGQGAVEVVDGFNQIDGKSLDGEILRGCDVACCPILEVAEVGDGPEVLVLVAKKC